MDVSQYLQLTASRCSSNPIDKYTCIICTEREVSHALYICSRWAQGEQKIPKENETAGRGTMKKDYRRLLFCCYCSARAHTLGDSLLPLLSNKVRPHLDEVSLHRVREQEREREREDAPTHSLSLLRRRRLLALQHHPARLRAFKF
jgi:hypothetical protein